MKVKYIKTFYKLRLNWLLLMVTMLSISSCERLHRISDRQIAVWFTDNADKFNYTARLALQNKVEGKIRLPLANGLTINGQFFSQQEQDLFQEALELLLTSSDLLNKDVIFNLDDENSVKSIYFVLYIEGLCLIFSDCKTSYLVYYPRKGNPIKESQYVYRKLSEAGWYSLKIHDN